VHERPILLGHVAREVDGPAADGTQHAVGPREGAVAFPHVEIGIGDLAHQERVEDVVEHVPAMANGPAGSK